MKRLFVLLFVVSSALSSFAECESCCGGCVDEILSAISNTQQNACSSNCTKLSPARCMEIKDGLGTFVADLLRELNDNSGLVDRIVRFADEASMEVRSIQSLLRVASDGVQSVLSDLSSPDFSSVRSSLNDAISRCLSVSSAWHNVSIRADGSMATTSLLVTNVDTGVTYSPRGTNRPLRFTGFVSDLIIDALGYLDTAEQSGNITGLRANLQASLATISAAQSIIDTMASNDDSSSIYNIQMTASGLNSSFESLRTEATGLSSLVSSFDCSPCGDGDGSSGGGGGGGGGGGCTSLDITPVVTAINELKELVDEKADRLYQLVESFFSDFNSTSGPFYSKPKLADYHDLSSNWFDRVEYLLYSIAYESMTNNAEEAVRDSPEGYSAIEASITQKKEAMTSDLGETSNILNDSLNSFKTAFENLSSGLLNLKPTGSNGNFSSDEVILALKNGTKLLYVGEQSAGTLNAFFEKFKQVLRVFWLLLTASLYGFGMVLYLRYVITAVKWLFQSTLEALS